MQIIQNIHVYLLPWKEFRFSKEIANNARDDLKSLKAVDPIFCFRIKVNDLYPIVTFFTVAKGRKRKSKSKWILLAFQNKKISQKS